VIEAEVPPGKSLVHRTMADGCFELIFHYKGHFDELNAADKIEKYSASSIRGQTKKYRRFTTTENFGIFGAYLFPFAVPQLFSVPSTDLSNQIIDIDTFIGREGKELEEKIMLANSNLKRAEILSTFLERLFLKKQKTAGIIYIFFN
jgi:hypothetical protein